MKKVLGLATLLALMTPVPGVAKDSWYDGIYIGFGGGAGRLEADLNKLGLLPQDTGESIESNEYSKTSFTGKLIGGYRIFRYMAVELSYMEFYNTEQQYCFLDDTGGCTESRGIPTPPPPGPVSAISSSAWSVELPTKTYSAFAIGLLPFGTDDAFEGFIKLGVVNWETQARAGEVIVGNFVPVKPPLVPATNAPISKKLDGTDVAGGIGMSFNHSSGVTIRSELEYYDLTDFDLSAVLSMSVIYNF